MAFRKRVTTCPVEDVNLRESNLSMILNFQTLYDEVRKHTQQRSSDKDKSFVLLPRNMIPENFLKMYSRKESNFYNYIIYFEPISITNESDIRSFVGPDPQYPELEKIIESSSSSSSSSSASINPSSSSSSSSSSNSGETEYIIYQKNVITTCLPIIGRLEALILLGGTNNIRGRIYIKPYVLKKNAQPWEDPFMLAPNSTFLMFEWHTGKNAFEILKDDDTIYVPAVQNEYRFFGLSHRFFRSGFMKQQITDRTFIADYSNDLLLKRVLYIYGRFEKTGVYFLMDRIERLFDVGYLLLRDIHKDEIILKKNANPFTVDNYKASIAAKRHRVHTSMITIIDLLFELKELTISFDKFRT